MIFAIVIGFMTAYMAKRVVIIMSSITGGIAIGTALGSQVGQGSKVPQILFFSLLFIALGMIYQFKSHRGIGFGKSSTKSLVPSMQQNEAEIATTASLEQNEVWPNDDETLVNENTEENQNVVGQDRKLNGVDERLLTSFNAYQEKVSLILGDLKGKSKEQLAYLVFGFICLIGMFKQLITSSSQVQYLGALILIGISIFGYFKASTLFTDQEFNQELHLCIKQLGRLTNTIKPLNKIKESLSTVLIITLAVIAICTLIAMQNRELISLESLLLVIASYFLVILILIMAGKNDFQSAGKATMILSVINLAKLLKDLFINANYMNVYYGIKFLFFWTLGWLMIKIAEQAFSDKERVVQSGVNRGVNM